MSTYDDSQEQEDKARIRTTLDHIQDHPDPYPFVLALTKQVLMAGRQADNIGGSEPAILRACIDAMHRVLEEQDSASVGVFDHGLS